MAFMRKRYTAEQREQLIAAVRAGEKTAVVAAKLSVGEATAYQWVKEATAPVFAQVVPARDGRSSSLRVEVGGAMVHVENGFDPALLRKVIAALS